MSSYSISSKIDGFENLSLKIVGFGQTRRTHADEAPAQVPIAQDLYFAASSKTTKKRVMGLYS